MSRPRRERISCAAALLAVALPFSAALAADLGRWAGKARAMARQLKGQLEQEAGSLNELRKPFDEIRNPLNDLRNPLDTGSQKPETIHTPPPAAEATPDRTDESKSA